MPKYLVAIPEIDLVVVAVEANSPEDAYYQMDSGIGEKVGVIRDCPDEWSLVFSDDKDDYPQPIYIELEGV